MDENLIGYLLNALDPDDCARTEKYLRENADARRKLETLQASLLPLESIAEPAAPPPRLVERTLARALGSSPVTLGREHVVSPSRWRRIDVLVACSIMVLVGGLGMSGLVRLREQQNIALCQNGLRQYGQALNGFAMTRHGAYPQVSDQPPLNYATAVVPILVESGQLPQSGRPDCPVVQAVANEPTSYAYSLGYRDADGRLQGLRRDAKDGDSDLTPIMADRPSPTPHGRGFNVLYVGGNVRYATSPNVGLGGDNIYLNKANRVEAGINRSDSVLAPDHTSP